MPDALVTPSLSGSGDTIPDSPSTRAAHEERIRNRASIDGPEDVDNVLVDPVLRLIPDGPAARMAFHELAQKKLQGEGIDSHHARFIDIQGKAPLSAGEGYEDSESGSTSAESDDMPWMPKDPIYQGCFQLDLSECVPLTSGRWVLGKGVPVRRNMRAQNVDILLAAPGSRYRRHIAAAHAFVRLHPRSGALMIRAGALCKTVHSSNRIGEALVVDDPAGIVECDHEAVLLDGIPLRHGACRALTRPRTTLVLGGLHFSIEVGIDTVLKETLYLKQREVYFQSMEMPLLDRNVSGIPLQSDILTPMATFRRPLGKGSFGTVYDGFHPQSGDPRAVKRIPLINSRHQSAVQREIDISAQFSNNVGIVEFYGWCNASGEQSLDGPKPFDVFLIQEKGVSFLDHTRKAQSEAPDWALCSRLCKQLLMGLSAIHSAGCMHRDVTPMNILYFSDEANPHAALCDFGKLCDTPSHTDTALAAWMWLPPEIVKGKRRVYDQKIDIYMLGLALYFSWFPTDLPRDQLNVKDHAYAAANLARCTAEMPSPGAELAFLLSCMLAWDSKHRPSAAEALQTPFMESVNHGNVDAAGQRRTAVGTAERKRLREDGFM